MVATFGGKKQIIMSKTTISTYKSPAKNLMGEWTAQFDVGETQIQIITPKRSDRTILVKEIKSLLKRLAL